MESATRLDPLDLPSEAASIRTPIRLPRPTVTAPSAVTVPSAATILPARDAASGEAAPAGQTAEEEFFCADCRHAQFDRARSLCLCTSPVAEFARQTIFAGQPACGWFDKKTKRVYKWSICSGRMF